MSTYRLENLFEPRSVALVGASPREGSLGKALLANLNDGGFPGALHLVNPHHREIEGSPLRGVARRDREPRRCGDHRYAEGHGARAYRRGRAVGLPRGDHYHRRL